MSSATKLLATFGALALATFAFAGCAATTPSPRATPSQPPAASEAAEPSAPPATAEPDASGCTDSAWINLGSISASVTGTLVDRGARELAAGTVGFDEEGNIVSYTVAAGDVPNVIGERLCIANAGFLPSLNHTRTIHPDQVLRLNPDPSLPWVPYYNPADAPAGFLQIPYQSAIEAMGVAADAGDVDAMRAIWANDLSVMFTSLAHGDVIARARETGDLHVLRQLFS